MHAFQSARAQGSMASAAVVDTQLVQEAITTHIRSKQPLQQEAASLFSLPPAQSWAHHLCNVLQKRFVFVQQRAKTQNPDPGSQHIASIAVCIRGIIGWGWEKRKDSVPPGIKAWLEAMSLWGEVRSVWRNSASKWKLPNRERLLRGEFGMAACLLVLKAGPQIDC